MKQYKLYFTLAALVGMAALSGCATNNSNTTVVEDATNTNNTGNTNEPANVNGEVSTNTADENTNGDEGEVDTSDWLTYTNEEYGFSFRYPSDYIVSSREDSKGDDLIDDPGVVFIIQKKITEIYTDPVSITLYDHLVPHPTADDVNNLQFTFGPRLISADQYSTQNYAGEKFRVTELTESAPVEEQQNLKRTGEYYFLDSDSRTIQIRVTDDSNTIVNTKALLDSISF